MTAVENELRRASFLDSLLVFLSFLTSDWFFVVSPIVMRMLPIKPITNRSFIEFSADKLGNNINAPTVSLDHQDCCCFSSGFGGDADATGGFMSGFAGGFVSGFAGGFVSGFAGGFVSGVSSGFVSGVSSGATTGVCDGVDDDAGVCDGASSGDAGAGATTDADDDAAGNCAGGGFADADDDAAGNCAGGGFADADDCRSDDAGAGADDCKSGADADDCKSGAGFAGAGGGESGAGEKYDCSLVSSSFVSCASFVAWSNASDDSFFGKSGGSCICPVLIQESSLLIRLISTFFGPIILYYNIYTNRFALKLLKEATQYTI
jgi:hypothetical protein